MSVGSNTDRGPEGRELAESKLITREELELLGEYMLEILDENKEIREITFKRKREGRGYAFYLHVPLEWVKKLGLEEPLEKGSMKVRALIDFKKRALTVKFPEQ